MKDITVTSPEEQAIITACRDMLNTMGVMKKVPQDKQDVAIKIAAAQNLNPLKRECHFLPFKDDTGEQSIAVVTAYEVYIDRAEASGQLEGWFVEFEGDVVLTKEEREYYDKYTNTKRSIW